MSIKLPKQAKVLKNLFPALNSASTAKLSKSEQATLFINNPKEFSHQDGSEEIKFRGIINPLLSMPEKKKGAKYSQINISQIKNEVSDSNTIEFRVKDKVRLDRKMRKYQPTNSSFTIFYGEKKAIENKKMLVENGNAHLRPDEEINIDRTQKTNLHKINLPNLKFKILQQNSRSKQLEFDSYSQIKSRLHEDMKRMRNDQSSKSLKIKNKQIWIQNLKYVAKLRDIYEMSSSKQNSERVLRKAGINIEELDKKYEKLKDEAEEMIQDVGNYKLEEETSHEYRANS